MCDGHYCLVRDLGPVKGGKGMKHHEVIIDFNRRGMMVLLKRLLKRSAKAQQVSHAAPDGVPARSGI